MTRRDLRWRLGGLAPFGGAATLGLVSNTESIQSNPGVGVSLGLLAFLLYLAGAVLAIQGERVPRAWSAWRAGDRRSPRPMQPKRKRRPGDRMHR